jgi:hypothetical protein
VVVQLRDLDVAPMELPPEIKQEATANILALNQYSKKIDLKIFR